MGFSPSSAARVEEIIDRPAALVVSG